MNWSYIPHKGKPSNYFSLEILRGECLIIQVFENKIVFKKSGQGGVCTSLNLWLEIECSLIQLIRSLKHTLLFSLLKLTLYSDIHLNYQGIWFYIILGVGLYQNKKITLIALFMRWITTFIYPRTTSKISMAT